MPPPPPAAPIDPELLRELGALTTEDHCRRFEHGVKEVARLEALLGRARKDRYRVGLALAERLDRERRDGDGPGHRAVDRVHYRPQADLKGISRTPLGGPAPATPDGAPTLPGKWGGA